MQHPDISIIIPTYNRALDLNETLSTIFNQSVKANEIIIVDDSDNDDTESLIKRLNQILQQENLIYIKNEGIKSSAVARNAGVRKAKGDIVVFLDDDVILDKNYLSGIREVFESDPNALGAQGWMVQERRKGIFNDLLRAAAKVFFLGHTGVNECRVFPSTNVTYPSILDRTMPCQWLHGCNFSLRREAFEEFSFDERLEEYAWKEDLDFSYRIHKKYSDSLYITPKARLIHKESLAGRRPLKQTIMIKESYALYIFFKDFDFTIKDKIIFIWSKLGSFLFLLFSAREKGISYCLIESKYWLWAQLLCISHLKEIKKGDFQFILKSVNPSVCMSNVLMWI